MKNTGISTKLKQAASLLLTAFILASGAAASETAPTDYGKLREQMDATGTAALSYISQSNYQLAYLSLTEYAELADTLASAKQIHPYYADTAAAWRDFYEYSPVVCAATDNKIFMGSDGYFAKGADAVRLTVPFDRADVEDYLHLIPKTSEELCVLVTLEVESERALMNIAKGDKDSRLIENLRTLSRIEGRVYLAFCPGVNNKIITNSAHMSYVNAFRHIADAVRRYAPNVSTVYSLGDLIAAGDDTVAKFYPGDEYVDVFGVELINKYSRSLTTAEESAWDRRAEYYDPVYSVKFMADTFARVTGRDIPLIVTGCAFPWSGYSAREDWAQIMTEFYTKLPLACPNLTAILYRNESDSYGVCNLRQNESAAAVYESCIAEGAVSAVPFESITPAAYTPIRLSAYTQRMFGTSPAEVYLDGEPAPDGVVFTKGEHTLTVYLTDDDFNSKIEYSVTVSSNGKVTVRKTDPAYDYSGNGILDFGDSQMLIAYIGNRQLDMKGLPTDLNGDGSTNIRDVSALLAMLRP